ncbi:hypothetical protein ZIOFF_028741 [Zingiber officinale]|uniref:Uncharacterized protein n=1 Tax=Zingiber officinale TaxID=94328 RepID=A0A8J5GND8_ZINOF|nr:hypothetical protein ZIOFF_028741 [Zingiber officinale]
MRAMGMQWRAYAGMKRQRCPGRRGMVCPCEVVDGDAMPPVGHTSNRQWDAQSVDMACVAVAMFAIGRGRSCDETGVGTLRGNFRDLFRKLLGQTAEMESEEASINLQENNNVLEITSENDGGGNDLRVDGISKCNGKRKYTSKAWNHFERVMVENIQFAECNYCKARLKAPASHGTTHLYKLAVMVILHDYALGIVDHEGFRDFITSLQPYFKMISRNTLKSDILKIYNEEKSNCYKLLGKIKCRIAITTDMWTSNNTKKGFMAVTGHFIDDSWTLQSVILRFIYIPAPHTAEILADKLAEFFLDWNIDRKVSTITVDNCTTNDVMLHLLLEKLPRKDLTLNGKIYGERSQFKVDEIRQNCYDLLLDYQSRTETRENNLSARSSVALGNISSSCASGRVSATLHKYDQFVASSDPITLISKTSELDTYLGESVLPRAENFDILSWWKTNGVKYPNLLKMARDILAIPVSTVASESAFSDSGRLVNPHRSTSTASDLSNWPTMLDEEEDDHEEHIADHSDIAQ